MKSCCVFLLMMFYASGAWASPAGEINAANRLLRQGKLDDAVEKYQAALRPDNASPLLEYNLGTALYKKGDYVSSVDHLGKAVGSKVKGLQPAALYNLGDALYKRGISQEEKNIDAAIADLGQSISNFDNALKINEKDSDARYNKEFVEKELQRLKKKKQEQQQKQDQQKKQQQKPEQDKDKQDKDEQSQQPPQNKEDQKKKEQEQQKQQQKPQPSQAPKDQGKQEQEDQSQADEDMSRKEAKDSLEDYERNQEPKALLNFVPKEKAEKPVLKDW